MATLEQICAQVQTYMQTLTGVRNAPAIPTDAAPAGTFTLCYPGGGNWQQRPAGGNKTGMHAIIVEVYLPYKDTARDLAALYPFYENVPNLLLKKLHGDNYWNGTIVTFESISDAKPITIDYQGIKHWVIQFTVNGVKTISPVT